MTTPQAPRSPAVPAAPTAADLQARLGVRLVSALSLRAQGLPHDIQARLRFAREQALQRAQFARSTRTDRVRAAGASAQLLGVATLSLAGGPAQSPGKPTWWLRTAGLLPLLLLVGGLMAIQTVRDHERVATAAAIDADLLADDLPPAAWSDPGFAEFLRSSPP